ncbi:type II toxin-antitoxin system RelE/ParE family toxin [Lentisphaera profundi]|uniref:Type II toxin-antitoxin system RelE/ParE family toxin n=1 Tax=Lentisphaera profundi TaxID=1658616 RepID=A0ABY7VRH5_9BACT|nr:type II toxin-antitoxin system RelE/ParE family toxin [Lentisphaera profundi]WDE96466.1 type II toxin-antitoxin system RelE/ParE family toxin [Lentisphaera profundi]
MTNLRYGKQVLKTYSLERHDLAKKEIEKLSPDLKRIFKKKVASILTNPHRPNSRLSGFKIPTYKIKSGSYRLVYEVHDHRVVITVLCVGLRARNKAYKLARQRSSRDENG